MKQLKFQIIILLFFFNNIHFSAQNKINVKYHAIYNLKYKINLDDKNDVNNENFILMISDNSSYYRSVNQFALDSIKQNKFLYRGDNTDKAKIEMDYASAFPENIYIHDDIIEVTNDVKGMYKFTYVEPKKMQWKISNQEQKINGIICKKATIRMFGRNWTAYYNDKVPFPVGPYKFNGLPGIIIKLYDDDQFFVYDLTDLKKKFNRTYNLINTKNYKKITKKQFFINRNKILDNIDNLGIEFKNADDRKKYQKAVTRMNRYEGRTIEIE